MIKQIYGKGKGLQQRIILLVLIVIMLITNCVSILASSYGEGLQKDAVNDWQIHSSKYGGDNPANKIVADDMLRIQKNVVPTDVENVFKVYLSIDAKKVTVTVKEIVTKMIDLKVSDYYICGSGNGFKDQNCIDDQTGPDSLYSEVLGDEKSIVSEGGPSFIVRVLYKGLEITKKSSVHLPVPNSSLYIKAGEEGCIALQNIKITGNGAFFDDSKIAETLDEINVPTGFEKNVVHNENVWTIINTMLLEPLTFTGDLVNPTLIIVVMVLSCLGIIGVAIHAKRED